MGVFGYYFECDRLTGSSQFPGMSINYMNETSIVLEPFQSRGHDRGDEEYG